MPGMGGRPRLLLLFLGAGLALLALAVLEPWLALAAEEAHRKVFSLKEEAFKLLNTLIVVAVLYKLAAKPLRGFLHERREGIRKSLSEAQQARHEAERELEAQRTKVADLEAELGRVRKTGHEERQDLHVRLQAEQETQVRRLVDQTKGAISLETARARAELQNEAARLALELAEQILAKSLGPEDQKRFVEEYLAGIGKGNGGRR